MHNSLSWSSSIAHLNFLKIIKLRKNIISPCPFSYHVLESTEGVIEF